MGVFWIKDNVLVVSPPCLDVLLLVGTGVSLGLLTYVWFPYYTRTLAPLTETAACISP